MSSTMMDVPLTIELIVDRAERWMADTEIVSRRPDKRLTRTTYRSVLPRPRRLARALVGAGIRKGDTVATLMWNHSEHLEAYFGIPLSGAMTHTLNLRLHPDEIAYIANHARDRFVIVDDVLLPLLDKVIAAGGSFERVLVVGSCGDRESYEAFLDTATDVALPQLAESDGLATCYTSGTTGMPKGVVYSHRSTLLHTLTAALPDTLDLSRSDTLMPVVPMFHVNAWGLPTIWLGIREAMDAAPDRWKLVPGLRMIVGGSAAPEQLIRDFDRLGMQRIHAWGMTEMSPLGLVSRVPPQLADADEATRYRIRAKQGVPPPLVDLRVRNEAGDIPCDDKTSGE